MNVHNLHSTQFLPITLQEAWAFFSSPRNLGKITPPSMNFGILYMSGGEKAYAGQIIRYKITILPLITIKWVTEIMQVQEPFLFIDEQRSGPYQLWHHEHRFKEVTGGVEMTDELNYAVPLGFLGTIAHVIFVRRQVNAIFEYRTKVLKDYFKPVKSGTLPE